MVAAEFDLGILNWHVFTLIWIDVRFLGLT